eukprot:TRINITY_DN6023_c0_g1_i2.p1 TRINITY_DN6023_c0_g1~~TRINITY_DN6023_c0_g1_i2.p1  ORF type:complete len:494 (-),score=161.05 TRINITY_DN6023_c0_g1_i2:410-1891(-)
MNPHGFRGEPDIWAASFAGDFDACRRLIESKSTSVTARDSSGNTPLHWAAYKNHLQLVKYYLGKITKGNNNLIEEDSMLSNEESMDHNSSSSYSLGRVAVAGLIDFQNYEQNQTPLHWAVIGGHVRIVHYLIKCGASVNLTDKSGYNALHHAVQNDHCLIVQYVLWRGADVNAKDKEGHNALHWAAYQGYNQIAMLLLNHRASVDELDDSRCSPLHWACIKGHPSIVKILIKHSPKKTPNLLKLKDKDNMTAEDVARSKGASDVVYYLRNVATSSFYLSNPKRKQKIWFYSTFFLTLVSFWTICNISLLFTLLVLGGLGWSLVKLFPTYIPANGDQTPHVIAWITAAFSSSAILYMWKILTFTASYAVETIFFFCFHVCFFYIYYSLVYSDPGIIKVEKMNFKSLVGMLEDESNDLPDICVTCNIRKPLRSKHCATCDVCVARFDHHCSCLNNCIGMNNHVQFIAVLFFIISINVMYIRFAFICNSIHFSSYH